MRIHDPGQLFLEPPPLDPEVERARHVAAAREKLLAMLADIEGALIMPWSAEEQRRNTTLVRQMTNWLPDAEAGDIRTRFADAMARLAGLQR